MRWWIIFIALLLCSPVCFGQTIPAGTALPVMLSTSIDAGKTKPGQQIKAKLMQDVTWASGYRIRAGSQLIGKIVRVDRDVAGRGSRIHLSFDRLHSRHHEAPVTTGLRAIASVMAVQSAELPTNARDRGSSPASWTTVQIGGDIVYRGGGHVVSGDTVVGEPVPGGVVGRLASVPRPSCNQAGVGEQALWLFSSSACGAYGFEDLIIERSVSLGEIDLAARKNVRVNAGSGLLLVTVGETVHWAAKTARKRN